MDCLGTYSCGSESVSDISLKIDIAVIDCIPLVIAVTTSPKKKKEKKHQKTCASLYSTQEFWLQTSRLLHSTEHNVHQQQCAHHQWDRQKENLGWREPAAATAKGLPTIAFFLCVCVCVKVHTDAWTHERFVSEYCIIFSRRVYKNFFLFFVLFFVVLVHACVCVHTFCCLSCW